MAFTDNRTRHWMYRVGIAAAVALIYVPAAKLGLELPFKSGYATVMWIWPAFGVGAGALIALGRSARWPVAAAVMGANCFIQLTSGAPLWAALVLGLAEVIQTLLTAGLVHHYFGADFGLDRLRHVLGLFAAAVIGDVVSGVWWIMVSRLFQAPTQPILTIFQNWSVGGVVGFISIAPLMIGLFIAVRHPPAPRELIEGTAALVALAMVTGIITSLPARLWETALPIIWLFPILLWLAARCRPVFAAAATFLVSITIVSTTVLGIGHFGDARLPIDERVLQAQVAILFVALGALVLAALFAERKESEACLAHSNVLLERERDNKLLNAQAVTASIAHEVRQPLAAIVNNANAALSYLERAPPDDDNARAALNDIVSDGHRANEVFHEIRALFEKIPQGRQRIDVNEIIVEGLRSLREELKNHGVTTHPELSPELPLISGYKNQLEHVIFNLIQNALEAMDMITDRSRMLRLTSKLRGRDAIVVAVEDSGPGIDQKQLEGIFGAFFTTKPHGMGLGLAICRMIIEQHGGQLTASSDGKNGTLFQLVLPIGLAETGSAER